jgi:hypothetical protein
MSENQNTEQKSSRIEWTELDQAVRRWAVMSGFEKDLERYRSLQEESNENVFRGYN